MIWGYIFIALITAATAYVLFAGDWEARIAILTLVGGSALTFLAVYLSGQYFESASLLASIDFLVLGVFLLHALLSRRYWTLCLPAFQFVTCITHVAKLIAPDIIPKVYSAAQGHWAYYQLLLIILAAHFHRVHRKLLQELEPGETLPRDGNHDA